MRKRNVSAPAALGAALGLVLVALSLFSTFVRADAFTGVLTPTAAVYLPLTFKDYGSIAPPSPSAGWLAYVNYQRALARLPAVTENATWSTPATNHSCYMVKNDYLGHDEPGGPSKPCYTSDGVVIAGRSNVMVSGTINTTDNQAIDLWMQGPFHAVGILDPHLLQVGFGSFRESGTGPGPTDWKMGATLDVIDGLGAIPPAVTFPVKWPSDGMAVNLRSYDGYESPNPLTSTGCSFSTPTGLPILLQIGDGSLTPNVTVYSFKQGATTLTSCEFDETNYTNSGDLAAQSLGRQVLAARDAIVLIPQAPLTPGAAYTASITTNGQTYTWSFSVSPSATSLQPLEGAPGWQVK